MVHDMRPTDKVKDLDSFTSEVIGVNTRIAELMRRDDGGFQHVFCDIGLE